MADLGIIAEGAFAEIDLQGKTYKIGKLTIGDFADFEEYVRTLREDKTVAMAKKLYGDNIPQSIFDRALAPPSDAEIEASQGSVTGISFLLWCAMRKFRDCTRSEVAGMVGLDDLPKLTKAMMPIDSSKKKKAAVEA